ncbi:unnamed protein product [Sphacelaria rigidula]
MFGKQAKLSFIRTIGCRAFVHKEGHLNKLEDKAWEGVQIGYDSDSPSYRIYDRHSGRISSSRNVTFIEQTSGAPTNLWQNPTPNTWEGNIDNQQYEEHTNQNNFDFNNNVFEGIKQLENVEDSSTTSTHPMRLRSASSVKQPTATSPTTTQQSNELLPNNYIQASSSPSATKWRAATLDELRSIQDHRVADTIPAGNVPPNNIIGTR